MADRQVAAFVDGCAYSPWDWWEKYSLTMPMVDMPAYELYVPALRRGVFGEKGRQLRVVIGREREVVGVAEV